MKENATVMATATEENATATVTEKTAPEKMTKKDKFTLVKDIIAESDSEHKTMLIEFIDHEIELIDKKTASRKPTETQKENTALLDVILSVLEVADKPLTISEIQAKSIALTAFTPQKMSALLKKLVDTNKVERTIEKRKAMFAFIHQ